MSDLPNVVCGKLGKTIKHPRGIIKQGFAILMVATPLLAFSPEPAAGQNWLPLANGVAGAIARGVVQGSRPAYPPPRYYYPQRRVIVREPVTAARPERAVERHHEGRIARHEERAEHRKARTERREAAHVVEGKPVAPAIGTAGAASAAAVAPAVAIPPIMPAAAVANNEITGPTGGSFH